MGLGGLAVWQIALLLLYFLPTFIAWRRRHKNLGSISLVNILIGWTILGWIAALIWSLVDSRKQQRAEI
jgi:hypothetical protein